MHSTLVLKGSFSINVYWLFKSFLLTGINKYSGVDSDFISNGILIKDSSVIGPRSYNHRDGKKSTENEQDQ